MTSEKVNYLYRVEETTYSAGVDEYGDPLPGGPTRPNLLMIPVIRETPKGWWVPDNRGISMKRWVSKNRNIPYACTTVEKAVEAFKYRIGYRILRAKREISRLEEVRDRLEREGFYSDERQWVNPSKPDILIESGYYENH